MPHNIALISKLLRRASYWQECSPDTFEAVLLGEQNVLVPDAALRSLHPLLPRSLRARMTWEKRQGEMPGFISRDTVGDTVNFLQYGGVAFVDTTHRLQVLSSIDAMWCPREAPHTLCIRGNALHLQCTLYNGVAIPFIVSNEWAAFLVARAELDKRYPGWAQRWAVAEELDLSAHDTGRYVFARSPYVDAEWVLDNVTFD